MQHKYKKYKIKYLKYLNKQISGSTTESQAYLTLDEMIPFFNQLEIWTSPKEDETSDEIQKIINICLRKFRTLKSVINLEKATEEEKADLEKIKEEEKGNLEQLMNTLTSVSSEEIIDSDDNR